MHSIIEVTNISEIQKHLSTFSGMGLFAVDIDETILVTKQIFGSSRWFHALVPKLQKMFDNYAESYEHAVDLYTYAQTHTAVDLVEGDATLEFVDWAHENHKLIYVTARGNLVARVTEEQLRGNRIKHNHTADFKDHAIDLQAYVPRSHAQNGIIYTHSGDKGTCLEHYLAAIEFDLSSFDFIVGIDDRKRNLEQLAAAATRLNKPFVGFRYGALDHLLQEEDMVEIAELQYVRHRDKLDEDFISDEQARELLRQRKNNGSY